MRLSVLTFLFSSFLFLVCSTNALRNKITITTPQGLIEFANNVTSGNTYSGDTVYLGSDLVFTLDLSSQFVPIGNETNHFSGTFDGQGHVISNLVVGVSLQYVGLFGYPKGANIKNVVMDSSCSVTSSFVSSSIADTGSIVGDCDLCLIENIVNMASVTFTGSTEFNFCVSGIIGRLVHSSTVRNCVNYGTVTDSSNSTKDTYIGGIIGMCGSSGEKSIQNCANYGTLTHNGTSTSNLYMGGIVGYNYYGTVNIENCVSAGKILNITSGSGNTYIGGVVGHIGSKSPTTITHCFWTSNVGCDTVYGHKDSSVSVTIVNSSLTELNTTTMDELNTYTIKNNTWSKWFILHLNGGIINSDINQETLIVTQKHFPDPVKKGSTFLFWCTDAECTEKYYPNTTDVTGITDLHGHYQPNTYTIEFYFGNGTKITKDMTYGEKYGIFPKIEEREGYTGRWYTEKEDGNTEEITENTIITIPVAFRLYSNYTINNYTLTFIFNNGENDEFRIVDYNSIIDYPNDLVKEGYSFNGWDINITNMPAHNINITAQWTINNYTLTFIFNNGENDEVRILNYGEVIEYPDDPVKEGYRFNVWDINITTMPAQNLSITAQWTLNKITNSTPGFVEIVFGKKDMREEEIREIIEKYVDKEFTIMKFEFDEETGGTRVIIKFVDKETAENFVENVKGDKTFEIINMLSGYAVSSTETVYPGLLLYNLLF